MIDKNDVKMPVWRDGAAIDFSDPEKVKKIEELLEQVNAIESKQELRLGNDYYSRFNWFKKSGRSDKSYFSYQEEAVYDFIFNLNKSGILSDQVGMGKTIEAGMIISELASRKELKSLLIIVPNEIMAQKWKSELEEKFGIRQIKDPAHPERIYPGVDTIRNYDDFCECVYHCVAKDFKAFNEHVYEHKYEPGAEKQTLAEIIRDYIYSDIRVAVDLINRCCRTNRYAGGIKVSFDGEEFRIANTSIVRKYVYGRNGGINKYLSARGAQNNNPEAAINNGRFASNYNGLILGELRDLFCLLGDYFATRPGVMTAVARSLKNDYPILVIPISYTEKQGNEYVTKEFLNRTLSDNADSYKHQYYKNGENVLSRENYRIIDFFIDVGYQTLIVDEVHDYIDVCAKVKRSGSGNPYPSETYDRYELFDDYYFIKKSSLYKKLKRLADKAVRKIFLTATPIKSDMVDFYLLTLIASNKDADLYNELGRALENSYSQLAERNGAIEDLCGALVDAGIANAVHEYHINYGKYEMTESDSDNPLYPYFTQYVRENSGSEETLGKYLRGQVEYMTAEEIALGLISAFYAEKKGTVSLDIKEIVELLAESLRSADDLPSPMTRELITKIVFKSLLDNTVRMRFEEDFTIDGEHIKRIGDLLGLKDGPRRWFKTYRKYGIRHTRHQTYNLSGCDRLDKIRDERKKERFKNLPVWPKRDGKIIFLYRDDCFFDSFIEIRRELEDKGSDEVAIDDLPNYDTLLGTDEENAAHFEDAKAIFDYINDAMSGGVEGTHEPQSSNYESVELDDARMVDYKLALVDKLMAGSDPENLGVIRKKVLLFAEAESRDAILEWFRYQKCKPLYRGEPLDPAKEREYAAKWQRYNLIDDIKTICENDRWKVSDGLEGNALDDDGNLLAIIDPKRYEKGVDLQKADTIINFDINFDPLKMEQRIGRIDRIRPSGRSQEINIISFVPLNDMSGFVINFFANEMKMFTQWMGETTGIVSVDDSGDEDGEGEVGRGVSFESNVIALNTLYTSLYAACMSKDDLSETALAESAERMSKALKTDKDVTASDFCYLHALRKPFDTVFRNSISPQRKGYPVSGSRKRVIRFNSSYNVFAPCEAERCDNCPRRNQCRPNGGRVWNEFQKLYEAAAQFFALGKRFCDEEIDAYARRLGNINITSANASGNALTGVLTKRKDAFVSAEKRVMRALDEFRDASPSQSFTMPYDKFEEIFAPLRKLYWDNVAAIYVNGILERFYSQCDNVLRSAKKFEKFIKTFSIAEFMNNLDERE